VKPEKKTLSSESQDVSVQCSHHWVSILHLNCSKKLDLFETREYISIVEKRSSFLEHYLTMAMK